MEPIVLFSSIILRLRPNYCLQFNIQQFSYTAFHPCYPSYNINLCDNAEVKSVQTSAVEEKTFDTSASLNLKPPPIGRHKSFDDNEFSKKPTIVKKTVSAPADVQSYSIADLQIATGSFSVDHLVGEGSFGRVYRAQFDDGKVFLSHYFLNSTLDI